MVLIIYQLYLCKRPAGQWNPISMGGKGRWLDNVSIQHLWRSFKYENMYLNAYEIGSEARRHRQVPSFYNQTRPHSSMDETITGRCYHQGLLKTA